jgi:hypothetical protein
MPEIYKAIIDLVRQEIVSVIEQSLHNPSTLERKAELFVAVARLIEEVGIESVARMPVDQRRGLYVAKLGLAAEAISR